MSGEAKMENMISPLSASERYELNAFRAKAKLEAEEAQDWYLTQMRGMMNYIPPTSIADMQAAQNVGMNTQPSPSYVEEVLIETPGHDLTKLILRQAAYFLLLMLVVGVGLAVFL